MSLDGRVVHRAVGDKCVILRVGKTRVAKLKVPLMKKDTKKKMPNNRKAGSVDIKLRASNVLIRNGEQPEIPPKSNS